MKKFIKNNYKIILVSIFLVISLIYTSLNTFIINDDLPYSFFYRGNDRVTNLRQVYLNQLSDYVTINGRFIVHCIVQILLMYGKKLWSILNPIIMCISFLLMTDIIKKYIKDKKTHKIFMIISSLFLLMFNIKYVNYWVAGSVNYTWVVLVMIFAIWLYTKTKMNKYFILNFIVFAFLGSLQEMSLVFGIIFLTSIILYEYFTEKKIDYKKLLYWIPIIIGGYYLITAPGNSCRMSEYPDWYSKNIIQKLMISIPELSKAGMNFRNIMNIVPIVYTGSLIYKIYENKNKYKYSNYCVISMIILTLFCIVINSGWLYFVLVVMLFIMQAYVNFKENKNELTLMLLSSYAVAYSMIITPLYTSVRTNYVLYVMFILLIINNLDSFLIKEKIRKIIDITVPIVFSLTILFEIISFTYIGNVHKQRLEEIEKVKKNNLKVLTLKSIRYPFSSFHPDGNSPDNNYWAKRYFCNYYGLPQDITIINESLK